MKAHTKETQAQMTPDSSLQELIWKPAFYSKKGT